MADGCLDKAGGARRRERLGRGGVWSEVQGAKVKSTTQLARRTPAVNPAPWAYDITVCVSQSCMVQLFVCSFNPVMPYLTVSSRPFQARWLLLGVLVVATWPMGHSHSGHAPDVMDATRDAAHPPDETGDSKTGKTAFEDLDKDEDGRVTRKEFTVGSVGGAGT